MGRLHAVPVIEVSETRLNEYFDKMQPGGRRRTQHSRLKKFFNWGTQSGYLVVNPMEKMKPREKWNSNREIWVLKLIAESFL
jgi:hypothetical protein